MARYALADHVFVCVNGEHLVLLDVKEDRYWALEASATSGLGALVGGSPVKGADESNAAIPTDDTQEVIDLLRDRGLLTDSVPPGKDATPVNATRPTRELISDPEQTAGARAGSWWGFFMACARGPSSGSSAGKTSPRSRT